MPTALRRLYTADFFATALLDGRHRPVADSVSLFPRARYEANKECDDPARARQREQQRRRDSARGLGLRRLRRHVHDRVGEAALAARKNIFLIHRQRSTRSVSDPPQQ